MESSAQEEDENIEIEEIPANKPRYQNKKLKSLLLKLNKRKHLTENNSFAECIEEFNNGTPERADRTKMFPDFPPSKEIHSPFLNVQKAYSPLSTKNNLINP